MVGTNLGKCEWVWEEKLRWLNPRWWNSRWLPSSSWVRMNEFMLDWISLSQSHSGVRVFLSESGRRKQGVWIQHGRIQNDCHHQVESEWMSEGFFVQMVGTNLGKCEWVWEEKLRWLNPRWPNSRWLPSSIWVRMNEFESDWISLSQESEWSESFFEWTWEKIRRCMSPRWQCLNPTWYNSSWLLSSSWVRMNEWRFFLCKWWEPILASVSEFERKN